MSSHLWILNLQILT